MKIAIVCVLVLASASLSGCGSSNNGSEAKLPDEIAEKRQRRQDEWDKGLNDSTKGQGFVKSLDTYKDYKEKNGERPQSP